MSAVPSTEVVRFNSTLAGHIHKSFEVRRFIERKNYRSYY